MFSAYLPFLLPSASWCNTKTAPPFYHYLRCPSKRCYCYATHPSSLLPFLPLFFHSLTLWDWDGALSPTPLLDADTRAVFQGGGTGKEKKITLSQKENTTKQSKINQGLEKASFPHPQSLVFMSVRGTSSGWPLWSVLVGVKCYMQL